MPRWSTYPWEVLTHIEDVPCGLPNACSGLHAPIWELTRGSDFPLWMDRHSLQAAMHAKARHRGLRCHTAVQPEGLQVQFYWRGDN